MSSTNAAMPYDIYLLSVVHHITRRRKKKKKKKKEKRNRKKHYIYRSIPHCFISLSLSLLFFKLHSSVLHSGQEGVLDEVSVFALDWDEKAHLSIHSM
jgi:hypothetical protein